MSGFLNQALRQGCWCQQEPEKGGGLAWAPRSTGQAGACVTQPLALAGQLCCVLMAPGLPCGCTQNPAVFHVGMVSWSPRSGQRRALLMEAPPLLPCSVYTTGTGGRGRERVGEGSMLRLLPLIPKILAHPQGAVGQGGGLWEH